MKKVSFGEHNVIVDDQDYLWLCSNAWFVVPRSDGRGFYLARTDEDRKTVYFHREVLEAGAVEKVDHKNGNGLDNRRSNLRSSSHEQNMGNRRKNKNNTSGFKGVSLKKGKWIAKVGGKQLGTFATPELAFESYKKAAVEKYGEFARFE